MDKMSTYTGVQFSPLEPEEKNIEIVDIAHALSLMVRGNGHLKYFFSVAQHSLNCYKEAKQRGYSVRVQLALLLHDASEAYIADIIRPVKKYMPTYYEIEDKLQSIIYKKYLNSQLSDEEIKLVKTVDDDMLDWELDGLMSYELNKQKSALNSIPNFSERPFIEVEEEFLNAFNQLINKLTK